jgi:hypothetical protein
MPAITIDDDKSPSKSGAENAEPKESRKDEPEEGDTAGATKGEATGEEHQEEPAATELEVDLSGLTQDEEGNFVVQVDPEDPSFGVFKGKDLNELFQNILKGKRDSEVYIRQLKASGLDSKGYRGKSKVGEDDAPDVKFPDFDEILGDQVKRSRLPGEMFRWTKEQWREFEQENGAVETMEVRQQLKDVVKTAEIRYAEENVKSLNDLSLAEETNTVHDLLVDSGVDVSKFDYDAVLEGVYADSKNFNKSGVLRHGRIVAAAAKAVNAITKTTVSTKVEKDVKTKIAENLANKRGVRSEGASKAPFKSSQSAPPKNTQDAMNQILQDLKSKKA